MSEASTSRSADPLGGTAAQRARRRALVELVIKRGPTRVEDLAEGAGVSLMTVYRDVTALEEAHLIQRHRGLVVSVADAMHEAPAGFRMEQQDTAKRAIAARIAPLVEPNSSIMLDDSTTAAWLARELAGVAGLTIVTHSLLVAEQVAERDDVRLLIAGGEYQPWARAMVGRSTLAMIESLRVDLCVLSAAAVVESQCLHPYESMVALKQAMMRQSRRSVLAVDHTKFARTAMHAFAGLGEFDTVVVDGQTPGQVRERVEASGARLLVAP